MFAGFTWEGAWECWLATTATLNFGVLAFEVAATAADLAFVLFCAWVMLICALLAFEDNGAITPRVRPATVAAIRILFFIFLLAGNIPPLNSAKHTPSEGPPASRQHRIMV